MDEDRSRRIITVLAALGLVVSVLRLVPYVALPVDQPPESPATLAQDMELYEVSMREGSLYTMRAFHDVEQTCQDERADPRVARACTLFDEAVKHASDQGEIATAVRLLRSDGPQAGASGP